MGQGENVACPGPALERGLSASKLTQRLTFSTWQCWCKHEVEDLGHEGGVLRNGALVTLWEWLTCPQCSLSSSQCLPATVLSIMRQHKTLASCGCPSWVSRITSQSHSLFSHQLPSYKAAESRIRHSPTLSFWIISQKTFLTNAAKETDCLEMFFRNEI